MNRADPESKVDEESLSEQSLASMSVNSMLLPVAEEAMNVAGFEAGKYVQRLIDESSFSELLCQEGRIVKQIRSLDFDMQAMVYENYSMFIDAANTIRRMQVGFQDACSDADRLSEKMHRIAVQLPKVSRALTERRQRTAELSATHGLLQRLRFLFELPDKLRDCIRRGHETSNLKEFSQGVHHYLRAQQVLKQYHHMPSFKGIQADCDAIALEFRDALGNFLTSAASRNDAKNMAGCVQLLLDLGEPLEKLCTDCVAAFDVRLSKMLDTLERQNQAYSLSQAKEKQDDWARGGPDGGGANVTEMLEYVDTGCNTFYSEICSIICSYNETFSAGSKTVELVVDANIVPQKLIELLDGVIRRFFDLLRQRTRSETSSTSPIDPEDTVLLARALDRFYRRLWGLFRLIPSQTNEDGEKLFQTGLNLVSEASRDHCNVFLNYLSHKFQATLSEAKKDLVGRQSPTSKVARSSGQHGPTEMVLSGRRSLNNVLNALLTGVSRELRLLLPRLQTFLDADNMFASKLQFRAQFCREYVKEGLVAGYFRQILSFSDDLLLADKILEPDGAIVCPVSGFLLLLSRVFLDVKASIIPQTFEYVEELFPDNQGARPNSTCLVVEDLMDRFGQRALEGLNEYVRRRGQAVSAILLNPAAARNCLSTAKPVGVSPAMRRVLEEIDLIDKQVGALYEDSKAKLGDSSKKSRFGGQHRRYSIQVGGDLASGNCMKVHRPPPLQMSSVLASNIMKMFNDKIEIFSAVEFSHASVMTGIVKITLKTLLESARLQTFSQFGLQQMQVDCRYLQKHFWNLVSDEKLIAFLFDEIMSSTVHRCLAPVPMDPIAVEAICEKRYWDHFYPPSS